MAHHNMSAIVLNLLQIRYFLEHPLGGTTELPGIMVASNQHFVAGRGPTKNGQSLSFAQMKSPRIYTVSSVRTLAFQFSIILLFISFTSANGRLSKRTTLA